MTQARGSDIIFGASDIYYEYSTAENFNAYHVEGWVFGAHMWDGVRGSGNNLRLSLIFPHRRRAAPAILEFRVLPLSTNGGLFLGMRTSRTEVEYGSPSGFVMNAPSNRRYGEDTAETIKAIYPKDPQVARLETESLDYAPE